VRGKTRDQTGQESRSAGDRAVASMTAMDITIHVQEALVNPRNSFVGLPVKDIANAKAALAPR
jgi:hypothetical protein